MESLLKLAALSENMLVEVDDNSSYSTSCLLNQPDCTASNLVGGSPDRPISRSDLPIHMAVLPNGRRVPILKTLLTSACEKNCFYCANRAGRDFQRQTFHPEEMAKLYMNLFRTGVVNGLFLSSGVAGGGIHTQDRLLDTAYIMRNKLGYRGYLHLKIMPGAEYAQVERALQLADRVSINLEAPNTERLSNLAPQKVFIEELLRPLRWVEDIRQKQPPLHAWNGRWPSTTTQFVAGGAGENDLELLQTTFFLHRALHLSRVYYSGFKPVAGTPLENEPAINPWRQHRLYQASFLFRDYGFDLEDMPLAQEGFLPLDVDPKMAYAKTHLSDRPVEINWADYNELLRIPGIGPHGARAILAARSKGRLHNLADLKALGISTKRAAPFILVDGHQCAAQLLLW
jgi:predicted DNA-binding helix-hairpin-helix protein